MTRKNNDIDSRRPLKVRNAQFASNFARLLSKRNITPNQISVMSIFFAFLSAMCLFSLPYYSGITNLLLAVLAAIFMVHH